MSTQSVFIFWTTPLFYESVCRLLKHPNIILVGATSNYAAVSVDIERKRPNTIIVEDAGISHNDLVREYLDTYPWALKIILLSLNDNNLIVYHHEKRSMAQTEDLIQMIFSEFK